LDIEEEVEIEGKKVMMRVDTGADTTSVDENILLQLGLKPIRKRRANFGNEFIREVGLYAVRLSIKGCEIDALVFGRKKNLLGHDVLQKFEARVDEKEGKVEYRKCPTEIDVPTVWLEGG